MITADIVEHKKAKVKQRKAVALKSLAEKLKNGYNNYLELYKQPIMFRGSGKSDPRNLPAWFIDPGQSVRLSQNTSNEMIWLQSTLGNWSAYPKRTRSLICSNSADRASGYGTPFAVIPHNSAKIGVCLAYDFWQSFKKLNALGSGVANFNRNLYGLAIKLNCGYPAHNYNAFIKSLKRLDTRITIMTDGELHRLGDEDYEWSRDRLITEYYAKRRLQPSYRFIEFIADLLEPESNGFELATVASLKSHTADYRATFDSNELWTDSPCFLINSIHYTELRDQVLGTSDKPIIVPKEPLVSPLSAKATVPPLSAADKKKEHDDYQKKKAPPGVEPGDIDFIISRSKK